MKHKIGKLISRSHIIKEHGSANVSYSSLSHQQESYLCTKHFCLNCDSEFFFQMI
jgi:hypothetical protein